MSMKLAVSIGLFMIAAFVGVDIYLAADGLPGNTWSEILRRWAGATPVVPWVCGVLMGHFFHPVEGLRSPLPSPANIVVLVWITFVIGIIGLASLRWGNPIPPWFVVAPAMVAGAVLWPV